MYLVRRNRIQDKLRWALNIAGMALTVILILMLNDDLNGIFYRVTI